MSRNRAFFVIARNSSFTYKGKAVDTKQVARELGVRYVFEGSVRKSGNRVRVTGQFIEAEWDAIFGPIGLTATWSTSSICRISSLPVWSAR